MIRLLAALLLIAGPAAAQTQPAPPDGAVLVRFASTDGDLRGGAPTQLAGYLYRPNGPGPFPAVVALHGCSGLFVRNDAMGARQVDWARRFVALGYAVLLPDSFTPRGLRTLCPLTERPVSPWRERARDAYGALVWLQAQPFVRADQVALLGWSHGGNTVLAAIDAVRDRRGGARAEFAIAIAFYPGCLTVTTQAWRPRVPLLLLVGDADNWTPAAPCEPLRGQPRIDLVVYPGAHHDFDHPNQPVTTLRRMAFSADGSGNVVIGTHPAARADAIARVETALARAFAR